MLKVILNQFWKEHHEGVIAILSGGGAVVFSLTNVDLVLKVLVSLVTLIYISIKVYKLIKK